MSSKRNHHVLPRLYLKGFADPEDTSFLWVYKKGGGFKPGGNRHKNSPAHLPISRVAAVRDAYAYIRDDGTLDTDTYENELERLEKPSDAILRKIREKRVMLDEDEKGVFASYITLTRRRIPSRELNDPEKWRELVANLPLVRALRSPELASSINPDQKARIEEQLAEFEREPRKDVLLKSMVIGWERADLYIKKMRWRFLVAPNGAVFFTGDSPVYTSGLGLKSVAAELTFPISSDVTLHASWQPGSEGFIPAPEKYVKQLNRRTAKNSSELFCSISDLWISKFFNKKNHPEYSLSLIGEAMRPLWNNRHLDIPEEFLA